MQAGVTIRISDHLYEMSAADLRRLSGEDLFAYVQAGHQDAFAILFERYHRLVLRIALKMLRNAAEAEDLMQSVFFEIFRAAAQFDPARGTIKTWIAQYAYHRSLGRRQYLNARAALTDQEIDEISGIDFPNAAHPTAGMSEQEARRFVEQGLSTLNEAQRESLRLAFFDGLSMAEIADRRKESIANVRHHYYRGLAKLRNLLYGTVRREIEAMDERQEKSHVES